MTCDENQPRREWWIDEPLLRAMGNPSDDELRVLRLDDFGVIVSLLDDRQPLCYNAADATEGGWLLRRLPVPDGGTPSVEQMDEFVRLIRTLPPGVKAVVHCQTGGSRSGVMGAAYWIGQGLPLSDAIARIAAANPDVVITPGRKQALERFAVGCPR